MPGRTSWLVCYRSRPRRKMEWISEFNIPHQFWKLINIYHNWVINPLPSNPHRRHTSSAVARPQRSPPPGWSSKWLRSRQNKPEEQNATLNRERLYGWPRSLQIPSGWTISFSIFSSSLRGHPKSHSLQKKEAALLSIRMVLVSFVATRRDGTYFST